MPHGSAIRTIIAFSLIACAKADHSFDLGAGNWSGQSHAASAAVLASPPSFDSETSALVLREGNFIDVPGIGTGDLPTKAITIEAVVALERGTKWGNIIGYMQDNGDYERGFSLGYNESSFSVWISTGGRAIYAVADKPFVAGEWYHLVASYDGRRLTLSIDGELVASSEAIGQISYPEKAQFTIGAYRDKDEFYPMEGKIRDARVLGAATAVGATTNSQFTIRPSVQFLTPSSAKIRWGADPPGGTLSIGPNKPPGETITTSENEITLEEPGPEDDLLLSAQRRADP